MSVIHFKFRSATDYEVVSFEGSSVSLKELNDLIIAKKKMSKAKDFKLEISNESTKQVYVDDNIQIPKNSTVIVRRLPIDYVKPVIPTNLKEQMTVEQLSKIGNLATAQASEENKIQAMMIQSKMDDVFSASLPDKQRTPICYHCKAQGHVIRNCPLLVNQSSMISGSEPAHVFLRNTLGLPSLEEKKDADYASSLLAMSQIPDFLKCPQCSQLLDNAVLVPCCGTTFCEGCAGSYLDLYKVCPNCKKSAVNMEPIENVSMRKSVKSFKATKCGFSTINNAPPKLAAEPIASQGVSSGTPTTQNIVDTKFTNPAESSSTTSLADPPVAIPAIAAQQSFPFGMINPLMGMLFNPFAAMAAAAVAQNNLMGAAMRMQTMPSHQSSMTREMLKKNETSRKEPKLQNLLHGACVLRKDDFYTLQSGMKKRLRELNVSPSRYRPHQRRKHDDHHRHHSRNHNGSSRSNRNGATSPDKQQHSSSRYSHRDKQNDDYKDYDAHRSSKIKVSDNRHHDNDELKHESKKSRSQKTNNNVDESKYGGGDDQKKIENDIRESRSSRKRSRSKSDKDLKRRPKSDKNESTIKNNEKNRRDSDRSGRKNQNLRSFSRSRSHKSCSPHSSQRKKSNSKRKLEDDSDNQTKLSDSTTNTVFDRSIDKALPVTKRPKIVINV